ncbi:flippase-like domain-containing protein [Candidatus Falkowbacteria bacterium]|nr:flippase-like domain-containing protein [Candidatus Falkowbacteria bacterium]
MRFNKELVYRLFYVPIIFLIFYFLGRQLIENWQVVKDYQFVFRYHYLIGSCVLLGAAISFLALVWNRILRIIEPNHKIPNLLALRIYFISEFAKYLPGTFWTILGKVYLGSRAGVSKKNLAVSSFFDSFFSVVPSFILGVSLSFGSFNNLPIYARFLGALAIVGGLAIVHPKIFYPISNFVLRKFKKAEILPREFLSYKNILELFVWYLLTAVFVGIAFFLFLNSIVVLPISAILGIIGIYNLAVVAGIAAIYAPSGIGVREGALVLLLVNYIPLAVATLVSFAARIWFTLVEVILLGLVLLSDKVSRGD